MKARRVLTVWFLPLGLVACGSQEESKPKTAPARPPATAPASAEVGTKTAAVLAPTTPNYPSACSPACSGTQRCVLNAAGTRSCVNADVTLGIEDAIRTEATKGASDPQRPLPLAAVWCSGPAIEANHYIRNHVKTHPQEPYVAASIYQSSAFVVPRNEGGAFNLRYQLDLIDQG